MNKNGFTLTETLAVLVLLSILLMIAVPSVTALMDANKKNTFVTDAKRFLAKVENEVERNVEIDYPENDEILYFQLKHFNQNDFKKSPYGSLYDEENSFVTLEADHESENIKLNYKVYLVACEGDICYKTDGLLAFEEISKAKIIKSSGGINSSKKLPVDAILYIPQGEINEE